LFVRLSGEVKRVRSSNGPFHGLGYFLCLGALVGRKVRLMARFRRLTFAVRTSTACSHCVNEHEKRSKHLYSSITTIMPSSTRAPQYSILTSKLALSPFHYGPPSSGFPHLVSPSPSRSHTTDDRATKALFCRWIKKFSFS
jgi:hypothetical protein